jgi:hypothetical protein
VDWIHPVGALAIAAVLALSCSVRDVQLVSGPGGGAGAAAHGGAGNGGGAASPGGGGAGPGGGGTGGENCLNGIDDDNNGHTDCDDDACKNAGYSCVPASAGPPVTPPDGACGSGMGLVTVKTCSACACQPGNFGTCHLAYWLYANNDCSGVESSANVPTDGVCHDIASFGAGGASPTVGAIAAPVGDHNAACGTNAATQPATDIALCSPPQVGTGCSGTDVCVPPSTFSWCQLQDVGAVCATPYLFDDGAVFADTASSTCSCLCPAGDPDCSDTPDITFANVPSCGAGSTPIAADSACHDLGIDTVMSYRGPNGSLSASSASCSAAGELDGGGPNKRLCCLSDAWP